MLRYITKGNVSIKDRPRVFYAAHPKDHARYFDEVRADVYRTEDCVFFYLEPSDEPDEGYEADLSEMQLFVIPVTGYFLYEDSRAYRDFLFAREHHIPVLLLMQERGLDDLFRERCGDLQYLCKENEAEDGVPYEEKLSRFLSSVLVGEATAARIRAAFDAYIFLSYRKKDRAYAKRLMRLIHENDFCRDIAIWYDEYLTAGENFNEEIRAALSKSELFALAVTPNLVREENYVMSTEYPLAKEEHKRVLAVELEPTDREALARCYEGLPPCTPSHDREALSGALLDALQAIALRENDSDPVHNYLIGLAYLSGIDVEVDHARALALITDAAEAGLTEAIEKLALMYKQGEGVALDLDRAIYWQKRLFDTLAPRYTDAWEQRSQMVQKNGVITDDMKKAGDAASAAAEELAKLYFDQTAYDLALETYKMARNIAMDLFFDTEDKAHYLAKMMFNYRRCGLCMQQKRHLSHAIVYYDAVEDIGEKREYRDAFDDDSNRVFEPYQDDERVIIELLRAKSALSDIYTNHYPKEQIRFAIEYAEKSRKLAEKIDGSKSMVNRRLKRLPLLDLADALRKRWEPGDKEEVERLCLAYLVEAEADRKESDDLSVLRDLVHPYWRLADQTVTGRARAREYYRALTPILEEICERTGALSDKEDLIIHYGNGAQLYVSQDEEERKHYRYLCDKTIAMARELAPLTDSAEIYTSMLIAYWNKAIFGRECPIEERLADFKEALAIAKMLAERYPEDKSFEKDVTNLEKLIRMYSK